MTTAKARRKKAKKQVVCRTKRVKGKGGKVVRKRVCTPKTPAKRPTPKRPAKPGSPSLPTLPPGVQVPGLPPVVRPPVIVVPPP